MNMARSADGERSGAESPMRVLFDSPVIVC